MISQDKNEFVAAVAQLCARVERLEALAQTSPPAHFLPRAGGLVHQRMRELESMGNQSPQAQSAQSSGTSWWQPAPIEFGSPLASADAQIQGQPGQAGDSSSPVPGQPVHAGRTSANASAEQFKLAQAWNSSESPEHNKANASNQPSQSLELTIGKHLNKIGIALLVLGCAFGILYEFQFFGPGLKISSGIIGGVLLLWGGAWAEEKPDLRAWGRCIAGGGWALIYFSVFAAHHFPAVQIINSAILDMVLLAVISAGAVMHSLKYKSELITSIALMLGFVTTGISQVSVFSLFSSFVLIVALFALVHQMKWHKMLLWGEILFYAVYCTVVAPQIGSGDGSPLTVLTKLGFGTAYWLAFNAMIMEFRSEETSIFAMAATLLNCGCFVMQGMVTLSPAYENLRFLFLVASSAVYAALAVFARQWKSPKLESMNTALALFLVTAGLPMQVHGTNVVDLWSLEVPLLLWFALTFDSWMTEKFAIILAVCVAAGVACSNIVQPTNADTLHLIVCIASLAISTLICKFVRDRKGLYHGFWFGGLTLTALLAANHCHNWLPLADLAIFSLPLYLGFKLQEKVLRAMGVFGILLIGSLASLATYPNWGFMPIALTGLALHGIAHFYRSKPKTELENFEQELHPYFDFAAVALLATLSHIFAEGWVVVAWAIQATGLLWAGFQLRQKPLRWFGLSLFAMIMTHLLFVELATADTIYRIFAFIVAGAVLLAASYAYAQFSTRVDAPEPEPQPQL